MNQELIRINSIDGIEQVGILYTSKERTKKIVIHVHGLNGNFYENRFLDTLAKSYTNQNIDFLTCNNRGTNFITEFLKGDDFIVIGGCLERFQDCILDIQGIINWVKVKGYQEIILEGHSYGCNKVLYYYNETKDQNIKKIILLAPCDIPKEVEKFLTKEEYEQVKSLSTKLVHSGKEKEFVDFSIMANGKISAGTFYYDFLPNGKNDFLKYSASEKNDFLNQIDIPVSVIFGSDDECVLTEKIEVVKKYLKNNIQNCQIHIIEGANHSFQKKYKELEHVISK